MGSSTPVKSTSVFDVHALPAAAYVENYIAAFGR